MKNLILNSIFIFSVISGFSQNLFPEKFDGCITDQFALESDTTIAKMNPLELSEIILKGVDDKVRKKILGTLSLQVIVDTTGNSCLISIENKTNVRSSKLKLKKTIDETLHWKNITKKVAALIVIRFSKNRIDVKRLGVNGEKGMHELRN